MNRIIITPGRRRYIWLGTCNSGKGQYLPDANLSLIICMTAVEAIFVKKLVKNGYENMSSDAAAIVAEAIRKKPNLVLGLATGSTPLGMYKELIRMHK